MAVLDRSIPGYLTLKSNIIRHILFTALFALVFINIYAPFGLNTWLQVSDLRLLFYSSLLILTGVLVVVISRILMYHYCKRKGLSYPGYLAWVAGEIFLMAVVYTVLIKAVVDDPRDYLEVFKKSVLVTSLVLLLPYSMLWLYFTLRDRNFQLQSLIETAPEPPSSLRMIPFYDENGKLRFSVKPDDLLFLEAADNYVFVHYLDQDKKLKFMIRNSMKNILQSIPGNSLIQCHRSYLVNFDKVRIIKKEKDGLHLEMDTPDKLSLPVSKTYVDQVLKQFSK
ncbi:MAG: LytTR family transcriptional regulator [Bacteroidales bacterium]|nr:LytTR family transcriptional regulator [Bacteroidales bacterium]